MKPPPSLNHHSYTHQHASQSSKSGGGQSINSHKPPQIALVHSNGQEKGNLKSSSSPTHHDSSSDPLIHTIHPSMYKGKGHVNEATSKMLQTHFELGKMPSEKLRTGKHLICNSNSCSTSFIMEFPITPSNYCTNTSYKGVKQSTRPASASSIRRKSSFNKSDHVYELLHNDNCNSSITPLSSTKHQAQPMSSAVIMNPLSPASSKRMIEKYQQEERIHKNMVQQEEKLQQKFLKKQSSFSLVKQEMTQLNHSLRDHPHSPTPQPPGIIKQQLDQREFSNTRYAKQPLWKSRDREFTTFKIK